MESLNNTYWLNIANEKQVGGQQIAKLLLTRALRVPDALPDRLGDIGVPLVLLGRALMRRHGSLRRRGRALAGVSESPADLVVHAGPLPARPATAHEPVGAGAR